jgi:hypothetical protein
MFEDVPCCVSAVCSTVNARRSTVSVIGTRGEPIVGAVPNLTGATGKHFEELASVVRRRGRP